MLRFDDILERKVGQYPPSNTRQKIGLSTQDFREDLAISERITSVLKFDYFFIISNVMSKFN